MRKNHRDKIRRRVKRATGKSEVQVAEPSKTLKHGVERYGYDLKQEINVVLNTLAREN